jgi:hypothetical protein
MEFLHTCSAGSKDSSGSVFSSKDSSGHDQIEKVIYLAPLAGVALDLILPLPSSLVHSIIVALLGSAVSGMLWAAFKYNGPKNFNFFIKNFKNFLFTPNMIKIFGNSSAKNVSTVWLSVLAASVALQMVIFTPGNASYLGHQVTKKIDDASGANLKVDCPAPKFFLYNEKIECRVKTGLLGITVPARATLSPWLGASEIKVSLF